MAQAQTNGDKERVLRILQHHGVAIYLTEIATDIESRFGLCLGVGSHVLSKILSDLVNEGRLVVWFDDVQADIAFLPQSTWDKEARQLVRGVSLERAQELRRQLSALELGDISIINDMLQAVEV